MITLTKVVYDLGFGVLWRVADNDDYLYPVYVVRDGDTYKIVDMRVNEAYNLEEMGKQRKMLNKALKILDKYFNDAEKRKELMNMVYGGFIEIE